MVLIDKIVIDITKYLLLSLIPVLAATFLTAFLSFIVQKHLKKLKDKKYNNNIKNTITCWANEIEEDVNDISKNTQKLADDIRKQENIVTPSIELTNSIIKKGMDVDVKDFVTSIAYNLQPDLKKIKEKKINYKKLAYRINKRMDYLDKVEMVIRNEYEKFSTIFNDLSLRWNSFFKEYRDVGIKADLSNEKDINKLFDTIKDSMTCFFNKTNQNNLENKQSSYSLKLFEVEVINKIIAYIDITINDKSRLDYKQYCKFINDALFGLKATITEFEATRDKYADLFKFYSKTICETYTKLKEDIVILENSEHVA